MFFSICLLQPISSWHSMGTSEIMNTPLLARIAPCVPCPLTGALPGWPSCACQPPYEGGPGTSSIEQTRRLRLRDGK